MKATIERNSKNSKVVLSSSQISLPSGDPASWSSGKMEISTRWRNVQDGPALDGNFFLKIIGRLKRDLKRQSSHYVDQYYLVPFMWGVPSFHVPLGVPFTMLPLLLCRRRLCLGRKAGMSKAMCAVTSGGQDSIVVKTSDPAIRPQGFKSYFYHLLAIWTWASCLAFYPSISRL